MAAMFNKFHQIEDLLAIVGSWERFHLILGILSSFSPISNSKESLLLSTRRMWEIGRFYLTKLFQGITSVHNVFQWRILGNMFLWTTIYMWRTTRPVSQNCSMAGIFNIRDFFKLIRKNLFHYLSCSANFTSFWFWSELFSRLKPK